MTSFFWFAPVRCFFWPVAMSLLLVSRASGAAPPPVAGANETTPSRAQYFSWINHTNEGPTAAQTEANLGFFSYLKEEYGMVLDIYAFDAGAIDGANFYGKVDSPRFRRQFPEGFGPLVSHAAAMGTRLGIWGGPDGFGDTPAETAARIEQTVRLCRDHNFALFKMDAVCGQLRPSAYEAFDRMMTQCRQFTPDLILLNHRLNLGPGIRHSTTFLLGGAETYIDVHMANEVTAPHHRAGALARELPPKLTRLTEDHGVCLSSCLDYWDDDLILQAFNRSLILAPEIYGNPWLLRDDELPRLAAIFNLHRRYAPLLTSGMELPEGSYGPKAVSRGDGRTRLITLRNLTWEPVTYSIELGEQIGLNADGAPEWRVTRLHPGIEDLGVHASGGRVAVEVAPFRSCLVRVGAELDPQLPLAGSSYEVVRDVPGRPLELQVQGEPGSHADLTLLGDRSRFTAASLDGQPADVLLRGQSIRVDFPGELQPKYIHPIADFKSVPVPADAESLYEATCFAADNNALELRSLARSGPTAIPAVQRARDAFFQQNIFRARELSDRFLFDGDTATAFSVSLRWGDPRNKGGGFRLDLGQVRPVTRLVLETPDEFSLQPLKSEEGVRAEVSMDLRTWKPVTFLAGTHMELDLAAAGPWRYLRFSPTPLRLTEVRGWEQDREVTDRTAWRASNLFAPYTRTHWLPAGVYSAQSAWAATALLPRVISSGAYLSVAVNGVHGVEGATVAFRIGGKLVGCPDRSPSFASNSWEVGVRASDRNTTYYLPLRPEWAGRTIEAVVLALDPAQKDLQPAIWLCAPSSPTVWKVLRLTRQ
ncbi:MAG: hypothetical protein SFV32_05670 [Opitutaceae bacterium]|nr:hypothetical protein [Opitutaceae bacterium]